MSDATALVQVTKDYNIFKTLTSNRKVDENHVKRLAKSMLENPHLFEARPILVNENMFVIDGQHRLRAAKKNNQQVFYMITDGITVEDTRLLNTTQTNWTLIDFAQSYASTGNEHYKAFLSAKSKYPNLTSTSIRLLMANGNTHSEVSDFKAGYFTVDRPELSDIYLENLSEIKKLTPMVSMNRALSTAFYQLFEKPDIFDVDYFISKLKTNAIDFLRSGETIKECMRSIEDVYNFNRFEKNHVRFY